MRVSTSQLQQLTIFTTVLTGGGVATMYYLQQKTFSESDYHRLAVEKLQSCTEALDLLGAPPLKVHNIRLTDRNNHVDQHAAQIKIPVAGSRSSGHVFASSLRDPQTNTWDLKHAVLRLLDGQMIDLLNPPSVNLDTRGEK